VGEDGEPRPAMILSAIIVNYGTAGYVEECARSILEADLGSGPGGGIEVIVVDNFTSEEERERLRHLDLPLRLVTLDDNRGYAGGLEAGLELATSGKIAFLNPDIRFLPGALETLCTYLDRAPDVGVVTPRAWLDEERMLLHPPHRLPGFREAGLSLLFGMGGVARRAVDRYRTAFALRYWASTDPVDAEMLTGCCLLTRRSVLETVGPPDPAYPLYFEDSDWCRRVGQESYRLVWHPGAELIHYYSVSANQAMEEAMKRYASSREVYLTRYYGRSGAWLLRRLLGFLDRRPREPERSGIAFTDLGRLDAPLALELPRGPGPRWLVEMAGIPTFDLSVGGLLPGPGFRIGPTTWKHMFPTRYFLRAVDPRTLRTEAAWTFEKERTEGTSPGSQGG